MVRYSYGTLNFKFQSPLHPSPLFSLSFLSSCLSPLRSLLFSLSSLLPPPSPAIAMRNRSRSPAKGQMPQSLDYTTVDTEEGFPSSFRRESKSLPCLRSYICRRRLSFAAVLGMFVGVGVIVSVAKMRSHGRFSEYQRILTLFSSLMCCLFACWLNEHVEDNNYSAWVYKKVFCVLQMGVIGHQSISMYF